MLDDCPLRQFENWLEQAVRAGLKELGPHVIGMDPNKWCEKMDEKDKGDWTANEAADYAKNCVGRD